MEIIALRAFSDNYIWVLRHQDNVAVVDPGTAAPVLEYLNQSGGKLCAILITHHHSDHIGGISDLLAQHAVPVYAPAAEQAKITTVTQPLNAGDQVKLPELGLEFSVLDIGGHTLGHIGYYNADKTYTLGGPILFCGDTLFAGGCGRIFEGTPKQMWHSLNQLAELPGDTRVYCAHEYTQSNLRFALAVEPGNTALQARNQSVAQLRAANKPTVPSTIAEERATNPFLRLQTPEVIAAARKFSQNNGITQPVDVFTAIRAWKNSF